MGRVRLSFRLLPSAFFLSNFTGLPLARQRTTMRIAAQGPTVRLLFTVTRVGRGRETRGIGL